MSWVILYTLANEIGVFTALTSLPTIYYSSKNLIFGSDTYRLEKKMEQIIKQNNNLKMELDKIKADNLLQDQNLKKLDYDIVTVYDISDMNNST